MFLRRVFAFYVLTLAVCLVFLSNRSTTPEPVRDVELHVGPPEVLIPEGAESPPKILATPKGERSVKALELSDFDIPVTALLAYQRAADIMAEVRPGCELPWTLLAAIGRVESNHGRYDGATLGSDGVSSPRVVGVALNGQGDVAKIPDTDGGRLDQDPTWDRAVGPMQFIPSTWALVGVDGDGDGSRSIHDLDDAALAAGVYLCAGSSDLRDGDAMRTALRRYNDSGYYVRLVMAYEEAYRGGDFNVSQPLGPVTAAASVLIGPDLGATAISPSARPGRQVRNLIEANARKAVTAAIKEGATTPGISASTASPAAGGSTSSGATPSKSRDAQGQTGSASSPSSGQSAGQSSSGSSGSPSNSGSPSSGSPSPEAPSTGSPSSGSPSTGSSSPGTAEPSEQPAAPQTSESSPESPSPSSSDAPSDTTKSDGASGEASPDPTACESQSAGPNASDSASPGPTDGATSDPCKSAESPAESAGTGSP